MEVHCFVGDLLGFSTLIKNLPIDEQPRRIQEWISLVKDAALKHEIDKYQIISDTIFATASANLIGLQKLISFGRQLLESGAKLALPIRGAIAYGDVNWEHEITFGKAIIKAYETAENQNWMGITLIDSPFAASLYDWNRLIVYPTPMKSGPICLRAVVVWTIPLYDEFVTAFTQKGLTIENQALEWPWANKIESTLLFSIYMRILAPYQHLLAPSNFIGSLPMALIDQLGSGKLFIQIDEHGKPKQITLGCQSNCCDCRAQ